jgi:transposase
LAPRKKNARRRNAWLIFFDESGISLLPVVRRTWAPRGKTPVIRHHFNWKRLSIAGALCYHSRRRRARVYLHTHPGAYKDFVLMDVITQLGRELRGDRATLLWDGLAGHTSGAMKAFLATQRHWLVVERLPAYAPELNPVEALWAQLKGRSLANCGWDTIDEAAAATEDGIATIRRSQQLLFSFLEHAGLPLHERHFD